MNSIENFFFESYYQKTFQFFLDKEFAIVQSPKSDDRSINILILQFHLFNPLFHFQHIIKKLNLHFYMFDENPKHVQYIQNQIFGEELEDHIHILSTSPFLFSQSDELKDISFDYIIIHHASFYEHKFPSLLKELASYQSTYAKLYFFYSISNSTPENIQQKNWIRSWVRNITDLPVGNIKSTLDILDILHELSYLYKKILHIPFLRKSYPFFGEHVLYAFILERNDSISTNFD